MKSGFNYNEYKEWAKNVGIAKDEFRIWLKKFLLTEAQRVVAKAKKRQQQAGAIDTGAMINSWYIGSQKINLMDAGGTSKSGKATVKIDVSKSDVLSIKVIGNVLEVEIGNPMEYSSFIEYGQRSYEGKYLLTLSINEVQRQLPARFNKAWLQFIESKGVV